MDPAKMILVVGGDDEEKFDKPLASLGKVATIDIKARQEAEKGPVK